MSTDKVKLVPTPDGAEHVPTVTSEQLHAAADRLVEDAVPQVLRNKLRFVVEKLTPGKVATLHVEFMDPGRPGLADSHTTCGKPTSNTWIRLIPGFFSACFSPAGDAVMTFELCDRCLRNEDSKMWVERFLGWEARLELETEEGTTFRWFDEDGRRTCVRHTTDIMQADEPPTGDLFEDDGDNDGDGEVGVETGGEETDND